MSQHTPEPWTPELQAALITFIESGSSNGREDLRKRCLRFVNGCAGLNPAGYRACVNALASLLSILGSYKEVQALGNVDAIKRAWQQAHEALDRAAGQQP